jgi:hypothetical protein
MPPLDPAPAPAPAPELQFRGIPHHVHAAAGRLGADPVRVAGEARALRPLTQISALASQLVNRARTELVGRDTLADSSQEVAAAILADMMKWHEVLEVATAAAGDIVDDLCTQFGVQPMSDEKKPITSTDQPVLPLPEQRPADTGLPTGPGAVLSGKPAPNPQESNVGALNSGREPEADVAAENAAQAESEAPSGDPQARRKVQEAHAAADEKREAETRAEAEPARGRLLPAADEDSDNPPAHKGKGRR